MRHLDICNCEQALDLQQDLHVIAKSIQLLTGRENSTEWEDLDPAWEVLEKYGYKFKEYSSNYKAKPEKWIKKKFAVPAKE